LAGLREQRRQSLQRLGIATSDPGILFEFPNGRRLVVEGCISIRAELIEIARLDIVRVDLTDARAFVEHLLPVTSAGKGRNLLDSFAPLLKTIHDLFGFGVQRSEETPVELLGCQREFLPD